MERRLFLGSLTVAAMAADVKTSKAKVVRLFKSPDGFPNAMETSPEGVWVGEQTTDTAYLLDWKTGKVKKKVETASSNTSGMAFGGGYLWMAANGFALGRSKKSTDHPSGAILKVDPKTGNTVAEWPIPNGGGGVHGLEYVDGHLWMASHKFTRLAKVDVRDGKFQPVHDIPVTLGRSHGLAWEAPNALWCMFSTDRVIHKLDAADGKILEIVTLAKDDPDPHGMCLWKGHLYYCDAGIAPPGVPNDSPASGYVCRIDL
jgi:streptogramin lyase